jgi:hypothetical protein
MSIRNAKKPALKDDLLEAGRVADVEQPLETFHSKPAAANVPDQQPLVPPQADEDDRANRERQTGRERRARHAHCRQTP